MSEQPNGTRNARTYRKRSTGELITDPYALRAIEHIVCRADSSETMCVLPDSESFPWEICLATFEQVYRSGRPKLLRQYKYDRRWTTEYHGVIYAPDNDDEATVWTPRFAIEGMTDQGACIVYADRGKGLKPYDANGNVVMKYASLPVHLYLAHRYCTREELPPDCCSDHLYAESLAIIDDVFVSSRTVAALLSK